MTEAANNMTDSTETAPAAGLVVIVPLFPRLPAIRGSLASLPAQTLKPDLVVLLDDGTNPDAESLAEILPVLRTEVIQTEPGQPGASLNQVIEHLEGFKFVSFLQAGDFYEPDRLRACAEAIEEPLEGRIPAAVVTALTGTDGRFEPLPSEDPRARHLEMLWAPGQRGIAVSEWLGIGNFPGPLSNVFMRREDLMAFPFPDQTPWSAYRCAIIAAMRGLLRVLEVPLLRHCPTPAERDLSSKNQRENLVAQLEILLALREKLATSPETRRNLAAFHRGAWNNLSGLREDLFQQSLMRLAASSSVEEAMDAGEETLRSRDAHQTPPHLRALLEGADPVDLTGYAAALQRALQDAEELRRENERLVRVAEAARDSGWIRFGAWLGERSARRMMEMKEEIADLPPGREISIPHMPEGPPRQEPDKT